MQLYNLTACGVIIIQGLNSQHSKFLNKAVVLKIVSTQGPISRLRLSEITGLSKMTISNIVMDYIKDGIMSASDTENSVIGRKADLITVVPDSLLTLGIYIGSSVINAGIINLQGAILRNEEISLSPDETEESFIRKLFMLVDLVKTEDILPRIWGIGVSSIGPLDPENGEILRMPFFRDIKGIKIVSPLEERYKLPVYLENDVNVSALAEMYFGNGQKYKNFIYVSVKTGIGSGIIINRELFSGSNGFGGELGHTSVQIDGVPCSCGNRGCLERYASIPDIVEWYNGQYMDPDSADRLAWLSIVDGARQGDAGCISAIERMSKYLSAVLVNAVNILDPECIFLGGEIGPALELMLPAVEDSIGKRKFSPIGHIPVLCPRFLSNSSFVGTAALVLDCKQKLKFNGDE